MKNIYIGGFIIITIIILVGIWFIYNSYFHYHKDILKENYILHITPEKLDEINMENAQQWVSTDYNSPYRYSTAGTGANCSINSYYKCSKNY